MTDYGSGALGPEGTPSVSTVETFAAAVVSGFWMFGDSIAMRVQRDLATKLNAAGAGPLAVETCGGRATTRCVDSLEDWLARIGSVPPRGVVMLSGTNDIFDPTVMPAQIDRAMRLVGCSAPVFWRDVQACRTAQPAAVQVADQRNSGWVNVALHDAAKRHPNLTVIPWSTWLASKPSRLTSYLDDGVHPNDAGVAFHNAIMLPILTGA